MAMLEQSCSTRWSSSDRKRASSCNAKAVLCRFDCISPNCACKSSTRVLRLSKSFCAGKERPAGAGDAPSISPSRSSSVCAWRSARRASKLLVTSLSSCELATPAPVPATRSSAAILTVCCSSIAPQFAVDSVRPSMRPSSNATTSSTLVDTGTSFCWTIASILFSKAVMVSSTLVMTNLRLSLRSSSTCFRLREGSSPGCKASSFASRECSESPAKPALSFGDSPALRTRDLTTRDSPEPKPDKA
mmetsp:Transcript_35752/g.65606  ORF Transcript_35752/g.65606 Transcript_35752/m.65606 type:complete len:246 (-) Transcript_35752:392-1129(-)